jgi:hypothetical protein
MGLKSGLEKQDLTTESKWNDCEEKEFWRKF